MKRIVIGHYADPDSVRDLRSVTERDHAIIIESLNHEKKKNEMILSWSPEMMQEEIDRMLSSDSLTSFQKDKISDLTPDAYRNILNGNLLMVKKLIEIFIEYNPTITNISPIHFGALINALTSYFRDLDLAINSSADELRKVLSVNTIAYGLSEEKINAGIKNLDNEDVMDVFYEKYQLIYRILNEINLPYSQEAEYLDDNGNIADTSAFFQTNSVKQDRTKLN